MTLQGARTLAYDFMKRAEKQRDPGLFTFRKAFDEWYAGKEYQNEKVKQNVKNRLERSIMPELENIPVTELKSPWRMTVSNLLRTNQKLSGRLCPTSTRC